MFIQKKKLKYLKAEACTWQGKSTVNKREMADYFTSFLTCLKSLKYVVLNKLGINSAQ